MDITERDDNYTGQCRGGCGHRKNGTRGRAVVHAKDRG